MNPETAPLPRTGPESSAETGTLSLRCHELSLTSHSGETGHTIKRCKEPIKEEESAPAADYGESGAGDFGAGDNGGSDWNPPAPTGISAHNEWESGPAPVAVSAGSAR
jgi:hypothetical protein